MSLECRTFATQKDRNISFKYYQIIINYMKNLTEVFVASELRNFAPDITKMSLANFASEMQEYQTKKGFYSFVLGYGGETGTTEERFKYAMSNMRKTIMSRIVTSTCSITNSLRIVERNTTLDLYNQYESLL